MRTMKLIAPVLVLGSLWSCGSGDAQQMGRSLRTYPVVEVNTDTILSYSEYPASIEGTTNSAIRAKVAGYITEVLVDEGEKVSRGQILFRLETQSLNQDAQAAQASVNAARVEVDRLKPLVEKGIISPVQLRTAEANLAQAEARFNSISASIGYATIESPVDGYVGAIPYRVGSLVSASDPTPLTTVADIDEVFVYFAMNESDYLDFLMQADGETQADRLAGLPPVQLQLSNGMIYKATGRIEAITGQVDPGTGTVSFRATFPNSDRIISNGSSGKIRVPVTYEDYLVIPEMSTYEQQGLIHVIRAQGDSLAVSSTIEIADRVGGLIVVESGLEAGDRIVAEGVGLIRNNTPIHTRTVSMDSLVHAINAVFK